MLQKLYITTRKVYITTTKRNLCDEQPIYENKITSFINTMRTF
jgi:hypothetical protein